MFELLPLVICLWKQRNLQNLPIEDFRQVVGDNVGKRVGNTQQPPSEVLEVLRRLCKRLEETANIQTRLPETVMFSGKEYESYPVDIPTIKSSMSSSNF